MHSWTYGFVTTGIACLHEVLPISDSTTKFSFVITIQHNFHIILAIYSLIKIH